MSWAKIKRWLYVQKEGITEGVITAVLIYANYQWHFTVSLLDWMKLPTTPSWLPWVIVIIIGATIGAVVDMLYKKKH